MVKSGSQVKSGEAIHNSIDGGKIGDVVRVRLYSGPLVDLLGEGSQIATLFGGSEITLPSNSFYEIR